MKPKINYEKNTFKKGYIYNISFFDPINTFPLHWHHYIEIICPLNKNAIYNVCGEEVLVEKGDILFVWPGELHAVNGLNDPEETLMLQFDAQIITNLKGFQNCAYLYYKTRVVSASLEKKKADRIKNILLDILYYDEKNYFLNELKVGQLILELIIQLGENFYEIKEKGNLKKSKLKTEEIMASICNYISQNCTQDLSLEELANRAGFSKFYFSKLFKQYTGQSLPEFKDRERIRLAETFLRDYNLSITDVSQEAGFNSISTFNRVFFEKKKVTPTEYRKMYLR